MTDRKTTPMPNRFWAKVDVRGEDDCWEWLGGKYTNGYGTIALPYSKGAISTSRYSAMLHFGMFDKRLHVLHTCDNRTCVNPNHLYLGDNIQNIADKVARRRHPGHSQTHCKHGHELTPDNLYIYHGRRNCRACALARSKARVKK